MRDATFMTLMRLLPKAALSRAAGAAARARMPAGLHRAAMRMFARRFRLEMEEAEHSFEGYATFAEFFARGLKPGRRPLAPGERVLSSPVDGAVSQVGYLEGDLCLQAQGIHFPAGALLGDEASAHKFAGGAFATIYLSPRDYHRIHAPLGGQILGYSYLPGEFWPVNAILVRNKQALFCLNERLVTFLMTPAGLCALVAVGATCVSRIHAAYDEVITHTGGPARVHRYERPIPVEKGAELGRFEMGSTVVLLFEPGRVRWEASLVADHPLRMGARIGEVT